MLQTENPNGNPNNARNKTPLEREFEQSQTYKVIHEVGDKVAQGLNQAGITSETVSRGINEAAKEINRAVDSLNRSLGGRSAQKGRYRSPQQNPAQNGGPYQYPYTNTQANAQYANPGRNGQNAQAPQGGYTYAPPQNRAQHGPYRAPHPVPPPVRPGMIEKRQPSNAKFWLAGALCALYALTMPMYDWIHLVPLALVGVGGFFLGRLIFKGKKYYVPVEAEKPKEEEKPKPEPKPEPEPERRASTGNPEVDKIIDEGYGYLKQLREANDRIPDEVMSARISRMEAASADIFAYIAENPEKAPQIRRFMNYYLPTTLRLLTSYEKLSRQRVKGENIQKTMFEIEGMMETIAGAFEKQLDSLFGEDAMDIAADISVMESILKQEGLSDDEDDELPQTKTAARGNRVEQVQAPGGMPTLELDPDAADNGEKKP